MTPKVSVIVCTYNQEDTIGAALDSILAQQTDFDFEVVVADDCSADRTPAICREYAERYPGKVHAILNDENKGIADNYYDTLYECRGKYIADLAGDDLWTDPNKLARQAALMDSDPSIVLCHGAWQYLHPDGSMSFSEDHAVPDQDYVVDGAKMLPYLLQHRKDEVFIHLCTSMYRRDTAIALTQKYSDFFYGRNLPCEDFQLEVLMAASGRLPHRPRQPVVDGKSGQGGNIREQGGRHDKETRRRAHLRPGPAQGLLHTADALRNIQGLHIGPQRCCPSSHGRLRLRVAAIAPESAVCACGHEIQATVDRLPHGL